MAVESPWNTRCGRANLGVTIVLAAAGFVTVVASSIALAGRWPLILPIWHRVLGGSIHPALAQIVRALATILLYLAGCRLLFRQRAWSFLAWSVLGGVAILLAVLGLSGKPIELLFACTTSQYCSGGFVMGWQMTPVTLHEWPSLMPDLRPYYPHLGISAPGWPLLYRGLSQVLERLPTASDALSNLLRPLGCNQWEFNSLSDAHVASAWIGIAGPLWVALTAIPLYVLGRMVADEESARAALVWWPLVLAPALFAASPSSTYALPATVIAVLVWSGVATPPVWRASLRFALAGGLFGATLVISFSLAPVALLCGGLIVCRAWQESGPRIGPVLRRTAAGALPFGLGLLAVWGAYTLAAGHFPLALLRIAMRLHEASGSDLSYLAGLGLNAWDFVLFTGVPICGLAIASAFSKRLPGVSCLAAALGGTLLALLLSGTARNEVGRVWAFFGPFVVLLGATVFRQLRPGLRWSLLAGQVLLLVAFAATFTPQVTRVSPLPDYSQVALPPLQAPESPVDATFGGALHLVGYQAQYRPPTRTLTLRLKWQALRRTDMPYYFSVVPVAPDGRPLPAVIWQPFATRYPTSCWQTGQPVVDQVELPLHPGAPAGDWWLSLAAFGILADQPQPRLTVSHPDGTVDTQLGLGPFHTDP